MSASVKIRRAKPLFRPELKRAPGHPIGDRVLVMEFPVESVTEGGIAIADTAKKHGFAGRIIAAGDQACDKLHDAGIEIGDEVWYAQFAGLVEQWQHLIKPGDNPACVHDSVWELVPKDDVKSWALVDTPSENTELRACRTCRALKLTDRVIALNVEDILVDVDLQVRLERGEVSRVQAKTDDGRTQYRLKRNVDRTDTLEIRRKESA